MDAYLYDAVRTPFGRNRGGLSHIRIDDLAALPLRELLGRNPSVAADQIGDVVLGNANGSGEDNRNVARMAVLLAGLPVTVPGLTVNRLCGSGAEAIAQAARMLAVGQADLVVAGGVEGMSRAPYVLPPIDSALPRSLALESTTVGWRMINPAFPEHWTEALGRSAERVAESKGISRARQDAWAFRSHTLAKAAWDAALHEDFVMTVDEVTCDESVRGGTSPAALAGLPPAFSPGGAVTAGNSSPINDGAVAVLMGTAAAGRRYGLNPLARIRGGAVAGLEPDRFAVAPVPAVRRVLDRSGLQLSDVAVLELNEAFAAMVLSCLDELDLPQDRVNPHGGAIALGHPVGASAARAVVDCARHLQRRGGGIGVIAACIGVGQGIAMVIES